MRKALKKFCLGVMNDNTTFLNYETICLGMTNEQEIPDIEILENETCPICSAQTLTLTEMERDIPFFGPIAVFSMDCSSCKYHKADVESLKEGEPAKYSVEVSSEDDLRIRIIKSSHATVKIPHVGSIEAGEAANGYITNIEGVLNRLKRQIEHLKETAEDASDKKKAKNLLKKLQKVLWGQEKIKLILEDPTGNSAIISEKAEKTKLKKTKKK